MIESVAFKNEMRECGYDVDKPANEGHRQVINVAWCMWKSQQRRIDMAHEKIARYFDAKRALEREISWAQGE